MDDYELLDAGDGARLERFGNHVVDRPHAGALAPRRRSDRWAEADLRFDRDRGWTGPGLRAAREAWSVRIVGLAFGLRPTAGGQVGLFPEHATQIDWLMAETNLRLRTDRPVEVLNLFAHTGLITLALARAGGRVTHVDSARTAIGWARRNAIANELADRPIRWIVDDARAYAARESRRERRYDGIVLDPPAYGHSTTRPWRLADDLPGLLSVCSDLLRDDGFVLLTAHSEGIAPEDLGTAVLRGRATSSSLATGELDLGSAAGGRLRLGAYARWSGRA